MPKLIGQAVLILINTVSGCLFQTPEYFGCSGPWMIEQSLPTEQDFLQPFVQLIKTSWKYLFNILQVGMKAQGHSRFISLMIVPYFVWDFTVPHAVCREEGGGWRTGHRDNISDNVFCTTRMQSEQKSTLTLLSVSWTCDSIYIFWSFQSQYWS